MENYGKLMSLVMILLSTTTLAVARATGGRELCHPEDKKALLGIKAWFKNTTDNPFSDWLPNTDCCVGWSMVGCSPTTHRVERLSINCDPTNNIYPGGTLPPSIGGLAHLQDLSFRKFGSISGTIPAIIGGLRHLVSVQLERNSLSGPIPLFFSRMTALRHLDLSDNQFSGSVPPQLGPALVTLDLSENRLTGPIPDFKQTRDSLRSLYLSHNHLTGPIPESLGRIKLEGLDLSSNRLCGPIPKLFSARGEIGFTNNLCLCGPPLTSSPCNSTTVAGLHTMYAN